MDNKKDETFEYNDEHCGGCGCGVDCDDHHHDDLDLGENVDEIIILTLDDDSEIECLILGVFEIEDDEYIALQPIGEDDILLYGYKELEDDEFDLIPIEDEKEFEMVSEAFDALFFEDEDFVEFGTYEDLED